MIDRAKVERALEIAERLGHTKVEIWHDTEGDKIQILSYSNSNHPADERINRLLEFVPRIKKQHYGGGDIWGVAQLDGVEIRLASIERCQGIEEEIQVPELLKTGRMIKQMRMRYDCPDEITRT